MLRKSRLFVGITLVVQAISFLCLFFILFAKKKSIAGAFLALSAAEGAAGTYLLYQLKEERKKTHDDEYFDEIDEFDLDDSMISDEPELMEIPVDESETEEEFKE
jgi:hypothetical protein